MRCASFHLFIGKIGQLLPTGRTVKTVAAVCAGLGNLSATDLIIHLPDVAPVTRQKILYQCDATGSQIGVPAAPFSVEYINGGGNSLVIVPISGNALIFANVSSGSDERYTAQQYTWWEAKKSASLYSNSLNGKLQTRCHPISHK